jgi:hypothetical protein
MLAIHDRKFLSDNVLQENCPNVECDVEVELNLRAQGVHIFVHMYSIIPSGFHSASSLITLFHPRVR